MSKLLKRVTSLVLAFTVMLTCVPLSALAANCTTHTPNTNGTDVLYYVTETEHYNICTTCCEKYDVAAHTNNGSGICSGCNATVDANNTHCHDAGNNQWTALDGMEHAADCAECSARIIGPHGDDANNPDGLCDLCGYGTPLCRNHVHKVVNGEYQYEIGPAGHRPICENCNQPYDGEVHYDKDSDSACDVCGVTITCDHTIGYRWWDTQETTHTLHCTCGYPVSPARSHTDAVQNSTGAAGTDKLCDECGVGVDSALKHTHVWSAAWSHNNDNTEHFNDCTDIACTVSTNVHNAVDADSNGICDNCNITMGNQGNMPSSCTHTPRMNDDGSYVYITGEEEHYNVCDNCSNAYTTGTAHTDANNDNQCDECHAPVAFTNGKYIHTHTLNPNGPFAVSPVHFDRCDTCGCDVNETAHTDSNSDNLCDGCGTTVTKDNDGFYRHYCVNSAPKPMDECSHAETCPNCVQRNNWESHSDSDNNGKCDKCSATLDANDIHIHQPDNNWKASGNDNHYCECAECESWIIESHDDADNDGFCDDCNRDLKCYHTRHQWYSTGHYTHELNCGDCGESIAPEGDHHDSDNDGKCDVCKVGIIDNAHTHEWSTQWDSGGTRAHFHNCIDTNCTTSTHSIAHADIDGDGACDDCGNTRLDEWCPQHVHNGEYIAMGDKHYRFCSSCGNGFGFAGNHGNVTDYISNGDVHTSVCGDCYAEFDPQPHRGIKGYESDQWGHTPICIDCLEPYGNYVEHSDQDMDYECDVCGEAVNHIISDDFIGADNGHANYCKYCGNIVPDTTIPHIDADKDLCCDVCGADVDANGVHHHDYKEWDHQENAHVKFCYNCGYRDMKTAVKHTDKNADGRCDGCNATLNINNMHHHEEKYTCDGNTTHIITCSGCDQFLSGGNHYDGNGDSVCDKCNGTLILLNISLDSSVIADFTAALNKAADRNDYADLKAITETEDDYLTAVVHAYKAAVTAGDKTEINFYLYQEVIPKDELYADNDLKAISDKAASMVVNGQTNFAFAVYVYALVEIDGEYAEMLLSVPGTEMKVDIKASDIAANRTWFVIGSSDLETFKKVGESGKGASAVSFIKGEMDDAYFLVYSDNTKLATPKATVKLNTSGKPVISWGAVSGATKYEVYRSVNGGEYKRLIQTIKNTVTHTGATAGNTYSYKVRAVDANGKYSDYSTVVTVTLADNKLATPKATVKLNTSGKPVISWNTVDGATKYEVYRSINGGEYKRLIQTVKKSVTHTGAVAGNTYSYKVRAVDANGKYSDYSTVVTVTLAKKLATPTASVKLNTSGKPVISWNTVDGAVKYEVYRSINGGEYKRLIQTVKKSVTHTGATAGNTYTYKVRAVDANGKCSEYSTVVTVTLTANKLAAPTATVKLNASGKPVISWNTVDGASKYEVYRSVNGGEYKRLIQTAKTSVTHTGATAGNTYTYKVRAVDASGKYSEYSTVLSIKP